MISRVISKYDLKSIGLFNIVGKKILSDESARALSNEIRLNVLDLKSQSAKLSKDLFKKILTKKMGLKKGQVVFFHSSVNKLNLEFPSIEVIELIRSIIGPQGSILTPTDSSLSSSSFFKSGEIFEIRKTPSVSGLLSEYLRRHKESTRSLHPTKSVCGIGPHVERLTNSHHNSIFPYDKCSPYMKLLDYDSVIIGLGVNTQNFAFNHCVEDFLGNEHPVSLYHKNCFSSKCIDYNGDEKVVKSYAHNVTYHKIPEFINKYIPKDLCEDFSVLGRDFFVCPRPKEWFELMIKLAKRGKTPYPFYSYKFKSILRF